MPYDRERTTMSDFTMCEACHEEYVDVNGRRYHAEPNACEQCGPSYQLLDKMVISVSLMIVLKLL